MSASLISHTWEAHFGFSLLTNVSERTTPQVPYAKRERCARMRTLLIIPQRGRSTAAGRIFGATSYIRDMLGVITLASVRAYGIARLSAALTSHF